jgi:hypothetical protein
LMQGDDGGIHLCLNLLNRSAGPCWQSKNPTSHATSVTLHQISQKMKCYETADKWQAQLSPQTITLNICDMVYIKKNNNLCPCAV